MRIWTIQALLSDVRRALPNKQVQLIHICSRCGSRTPEIFPLDSSMASPSIQPPEVFEIKNAGTCDECNKKAWGLAADKIEKEITKEIEARV